LLEHTPGKLGDFGSAAVWAPSVGILSSRKERRSLVSKTVVIGATGTVGSQAVQELVKRGAEVRVMTRSANRIASLPKGVAGVTGSMVEPASLPAVFAGADKLFLITPLDRDETAQGIDAVDG
jgi:uncharacterized protein YbjT (DUF2867 family)